MAHGYCEVTFFGHFECVPMENQPFVAKVRLKTARKWDFGLSVAPNLLKMTKYQFSINFRGWNPQCDPQWVSNLSPALQKLLKNRFSLIPNNFVENFRFHPNQIFPLVSPWNFFKIAEIDVKIVSNKFWEFVFVQLNAKTPRGTPQRSPWRSKRSFLSKKFHKVTGEAREFHLPDSLWLSPLKCIAQR